MSKLLAMFPGQGSQYVGMGKEVLDLFPKIAGPVFEEAQDAAKFSLKKLCLEGPEGQLLLTANTQPCILTVSIAIWKVLKEEAGIEPFAFAGHSLGEYSAVVASEKLSFSRAVELVRKRGQAMQEAVPAGVGAMAAVMNFDGTKLEELCKKMSSDKNVVEMANYNNPKQIVVAGHTDAVNALVKHLDDEGIRAVMLQVSAPFHSSLMIKAREVMTPLLQDSEFNANDNKIIANLTGKVEADYNVSFLAKQIDNPVRWTQTLETTQELGIDSYLEIGPGKVLFGLARRTLARGTELLVTEDLAKAIDLLNNR